MGSIQLYTVRLCERAHQSRVQGGADVDDTSIVGRLPETSRGGFFRQGGHEYTTVLVSFQTQVCVPTLNT